MNTKRTIVFFAIAILIISCNGNKKVEGEWMEDLYYGTIKAGTFYWNFYQDGTFRYTSDNSRIGIDHFPTSKYDMPRLTMKGSKKFITGTYKVKGDKIYLTQHGNTVIWSCKIQDNILILGTDAGGYYHLTQIR